jgi:hypothetical protein
MQIGNAIQALRAGWVLRNPEAWKNRTVTVNALTALFGLVLALAKEVAGYDLNLPDDVVAAAGLVVWGVFNAWSTLATSAKVGVRTHRDDDRLDGERGDAGGAGGPAF